MKLRVLLIILVFVFASWQGLGNSASSPSLFHFIKTHSFTLPSRKNTASEMADRRTISLDWQKSKKDEIFFGGETLRPLRKLQLASGYG